MNGIWNTFTTTDGLVGNFVRAIIESSDGALWFGSSPTGFLDPGGGVSRYHEGRWTTFTRADGLASNSVYSILESSNEALWFGTAGGVSRYKEGMWTTYTTADGLTDNWVVAIIESRDSALWFGTPGGGVSRYKESMWTTFTTANGLAGNIVYAIIESKDGALWLGTSGGVSRYYEGRWSTFTTTDGLTDNWVLAIVESRDGALWFGTAGGISRYKEGMWTTYTTADGLTDNWVVAIIESHDGALWFGTDIGGGVSRLIPDKSPPFTIIAEEHKKKLIGTPTPLFEVSGRDFRTRQDQLVYSYAVIDSSTAPNGSHWQPFDKRTAIQPALSQNGPYTFYVRARDAWGNIDPTPATWTFTIDITPPTVTINSPTTDGVVAGKVAIIGSAFDSSPIRDFKKYRLRYAYGPDREKIAESDWKSDNRFSGIQQYKEIRDSTLAIWDTEGLNNGPYWLQLSAWDTLRLSPRDTLGHESHDYVKVQVVRVSQPVDSRRGSQFSATDNLEIYIPPNAIQQDLQLNVRDWPIQEIVPKADPQVMFTNLCFKIELPPDNTELAKPATLTLHYPDSLLVNKSERKLALYYSSDGKSNWQRVGGSVDIEKNKITITFKQFGVFGLYEDLSTGNKAGILNVTSQPRVFSPQGGGFNTQTAISFDLGKEANVTIKIYNAAGRLVRVLTENEPMAYGTQVKYWDGKDQSGHYCLSGLHLVTIQAEDKMVTKTVVVLNK